MFTLLDHSTRPWWASLCPVTRLSLAALVGALLLIATRPTPVHAQALAADSQQVSAVHVVRRVEPPSGLERVRRRIAEIRGVTRQPVPASTPPPINISLDVSRASSGESGVTQRDLRRLERRLLRALDERFEEQVSRIGGERTVYDRVETAAPSARVRPVPPDTVRAKPDTVIVLPDSIRAAPDTVRVVEERVRTVRDTLFRTRVETVERRLLDEGVFRAFEVNFEFGASALEPRARRTLDAVGTVIEQYPRLEVEIAGHTDNVGASDVNLRLSQARAETVRDYLLEQFDIQPEQLVARGYGEDRPIQPNNTPATRALNRRVEFRVLNPDAATR